MPETITELANLWSRVQNNLEEKIEDQRFFDVFLKGTKIYSFENKQAVISAATEFAATILTTKYAPIISQTMKEIVGHDVKLTFQFEGELKKIVTEVEEKPQFFRNIRINPSLTFDSFISGPSNLEAKQAALFVANNLKTFNPLFIYAGPGLGKTHLLQAIVNEVKRNDPSKRCLYCDANDFVDQYVSNVSNINDLSNFVKSYDVLLIDDIQFLGAKENTLIFFFNTFNHFLNQGKQVVFSCDRHPSELKGFEERLKSRFVQGLTVSIERPDTNTCAEIIKSKISSGPIALEAFDPRIIDFIADKFSRNIREIDEALNKLIYYVTNYKPTKYIDFDIAMEALQSLVNVRDAKQKLSEQRILQEVADYYGVLQSQITGPSREGKIANARHIAMYLIRTLLDVPFTRIGYLFGGKDHSTVMNGVNKVEKSLKTNTALQQAINELKARLKS